MKMIKALGLSLMFALGSTSVVSASSIEEITNASYRLFTENDNFLCSGQFIESTKERDLFLTAAHCIDNMTQKYRIKRIKYNETLDPIYEEVFYAVPVKDYNKSDVAILKVLTPETAEFGTVDIATDEEAKLFLVPGAPVRSASHPRGEDLTYVDGLYTGLMKSPFDNEKGVLYNRATPDQYPGSSGGGLYTQINGEWKLVGTVTGGHGVVKIFNLFSLTKSINQIIKDVGPMTIKELPKETLQNK